MKGALGGSAIQWKEQWHQIDSCVTMVTMAKLPNLSGFEHIVLLKFANNGDSNLCPAEIL